MSHDGNSTFAGTVTDIFAHRFVIATKTGKILADLGPKGAERVCLREGDQVEVVGEMKPSELKVFRIARGGGSPVVIEHKKPHPREHDEADPVAIQRAVEARGFTVLGVPRRKPNHFEVLGRGKQGDYVELHVELDGSIRKAKPVDKSDYKWAAHLNEMT